MRLRRIDMAAPDHVARKHARRRQGQGLRVVHDDHVRLDGGVHGVLFNRVEILAEDLLERDGLLDALEKVVKLLRDLEKLRPALDRAPVSINAQPASQGNDAAKLLRNAPSLQGRVHAHPTLAFAGAGQAFQLLHADWSNERTVVFRRPREGGFVAFQIVSHRLRNCSSAVVQDSQGVAVSGTRSWGASRASAGTTVSSPAGQTSQAETRNISAPNCFGPLSHGSSLLSMGTRQEFARFP